MQVNQKTEEQNFAVLPVCILKDAFQNGELIPIVHQNDTVKPFHRTILKSVSDLLSPEYEFTKYHYHNGIELFRLNEGEATVVVNDRAHTAKPNDVFIFNPFEAHGIYLSSPNVSLTRTGILFRPHHLFPPENSENGERFFTDLKQLCFQNEIPAAHPAAVELCDCIDRIVSLAASQENGWSVSVFSEILRFYALMIFHGLSKRPEEHTSYTFDFMAKVSSYIEENLSQDISTTEIAAYCQYTTEHFCRLFKKCFGKTFKDYLNVYRIRCAKEFIDRGNFTTIAEISTRFGFNNQNHFGTMFKKYVGMLPSEYIGRQKNSN